MVNVSWPIGFLLRNGSFAMDSYFFLRFVLLKIQFKRKFTINFYSGIIMYQFFHGTIHINCSEKFYRVLHQMIYFFSVILFKLTRFLLPYLSILLLVKVANEYFSEVSAVEIPSNDDECERTIWRNLLFIDIFFPLDQRVTFVFKKKN